MYKCKNFYSDLRPEWMAISPSFVGHGKNVWKVGEKVKLRDGESLTPEVENACRA